MNHYERLKVTRDAPPEVIRAAYRALAQALPEDAQREAQQRALNTAYETLIDPDTRQAYDAAMAMAEPDIVLADAAPGCASQIDGAGVDLPLDALIAPGAIAANGEGEVAGMAEHLDDPWQAVYDAPQVAPRRPWARQPVVWGGIVVLMTAVIGAGIWLWQLYQVNQRTQKMAVPYGAAASGVSVPARGEHDAAPVARGAADELSVEALSRLSDEELLKVLPTLGEAGTARDGQERPLVSAPRAGRGTFAGGHPLDGTSLKLRTAGELLDPLAPEVTPPASASVR